MSNAPTRRLRAEQRRRQAALFRAANRASLAAGRAIAGLWRELLAVLRVTRGYTEDVRRVAAVLRRVGPVTAAVLRQRLAGLYFQGHRGAVAALPLTVLRRASRANAERTGGLGRGGHHPDRAGTGARGSGAQTAPTLEATAPGVLALTPSGVFDLTPEEEPDAGELHDNRLPSQLPDRNLPSAGAGDLSELRSGMVGNRGITAHGRKLYESSHEADPESLRKQVKKANRGLGEVIAGTKPVGTESKGGKEMARARELGMYTSDVAGFGIYARTAADAKPLEDYLRGGGRYGTPEFSRLLGYSAEEIETYTQFLAATGQQRLLRHDPDRGYVAPESEEPELEPEPDEEPFAGEPTLLPAPSMEDVMDWLSHLVRPLDYALVGTDSDRRIPDDLARSVALDMSQGKSQFEVAKNLRPHLDGSHMRARRAARTLGLVVAHAAQRQAWQGLGDMLIGYEVIHTQVPDSRPWHTARAGRKYYFDPAPGQDGMAQCPHPPEEPADPSERPAKAPRIAWNCLCALVPILGPIKSEPSPVEEPEPEPVAAPEPVVEPEKEKTGYVRAPAGGAVSPVDGKFYKGGQLMPIHGLYSGQEKPPPRPQPQPGDASPQSDKGGKGREPRPPRAPMSPEDIEAERLRHEMREKWHQVKAGELGRLISMGEHPHPLRSSATNIKDWKEYASTVGEAGLQRLAAALGPLIDQHIAREVKDRGPVTPEDEEWVRGEFQRQAEYDVQIVPGAKKHLKEVPSSLLVRQMVQSILSSANVNDLHALDQALRTARIQ